MRQTFGQLIQSAKDVCIDDTSTTYTGLSDTTTFIKRQINSTNTYLFSLLKKYKLQPPPYTESTVINQTYYNFRPGFSKLTSLTVNTGTYKPPLRIIESEDEWNRLQAIPNVSGWPQAVFPRRDTYGIYPTPQVVYIMTLTGLWIPLNMTVSDYATGTIALTNGSANIVGTGTTFTSNMVGQWIAVTDGNGFVTGNFYRVATYTDATHIAVDRNVIDTTASGQNFIIGQSPEIPEELHEFIPYRVGAAYYGLRRRNPEMAQSLLNYFYTGDYNNPKREGEITGGVLQVLRDLMEKGRSNSDLVETGGSGDIVDVIRYASWTSLISDPDA